MRHVVVSTAIAALLAAAPFSRAGAQGAPALSPASPTGSADDRALLQAAVAHRALGSDSAAAVIYFFSDYACPDCARFVTERLDSLLTAVVRPGRARIIHASFLIPRLLRGWQGASAAFCIAAITDASTFDEASRRIFAEQAQWATARDAAPTLRAIARDVGADPARYDDCIARDLMAPLILSDVRAGFAARLTGTPTLVVLSARALTDRTRDPFEGAIALSGSAPMRQILDAVEKVAKAK
ncbi:MAG: DsbA family protein [Gemmatimonadaceae bacterium]|nr:DsbA family protein [Gemmatimonadaceae bacterium]